MDSCCAQRSRRHSEPALSDALSRPVSAPEVLQELGRPPSPPAVGDTRYKASPLPARRTEPSPWCWWCAAPCQVLSPVVCSLCGVPSAAVVGSYLCFGCGPCCCAAPTCSTCADRNCCCPCGRYCCRQLLSSLRCEVPTFLSKVSMSLDDQLRLLQARQPTHLLVVYHGVGSSGPQHYQYLRDRVHEELTGERDGEEVVGVYLSLYATSTCCPTFCIADACGGAGCCNTLLSFLLTVSGVSALGTRAEAELNQVLQALPTVERLSLAGSSMGGLTAREVARRLKRRRSFLSCCMPERLAPELVNLLLLGAPNLGVRQSFMHQDVPCHNGRCSACVPPMWIAATERCITGGRDTFLRSAQLTSMAAQAPETCFMGERVVYAPWSDDGIVGYSTAALGALPDAEPPKAAVIDRGKVDEHAAVAWAQGNTAEAAMRRSLLAAGSWRLVDVSGCHSTAGAMVRTESLPTYQAGQRLHCLSDSACVVEHIVSVMGGQPPPDFLAPMLGLVEVPRNNGSGQSEELKLALALSLVSWTCPRCTFINHGSHCSMCSLPQPDAEAGSPAVQGTAVVTIDGAGSPLLICSPAVSPSRLREAELPAALAHPSRAQYSPRALPGSPPLAARSNIADTGHRTPPLGPQHHGT
eukprot:TRINITY_DN2203_c0_g1_i3.p1 TRINITY_DN2203_c0_g1~~TRINITY_DN2203_c0_g1_i3.p1  ORF type:complete len:639 (+),score=15.59 TRINITY_DN2203_c0_g1_i3:123-2039(+)